MPRGKDKSKRVVSPRSIANLQPRREGKPGYESLNVRFYVPQSTASFIRCKDADERGEILHRAVKSIT